MHPILPIRLSFFALLGAAGLKGAPPVPAAPVLPSPSSHREAPFVSEHPKIDATDFYFFRSYEAGRQGFVTLVANYMPLEAPYGGPNYFFMDPEALYEIHLDTNGDALEDLTFQFRFQNQFQQQALDIGPVGAKVSVPIPLIQKGAVAGLDDPDLNLRERYTVTLVSGDRRTGTSVPVTNDADGSATFTKPADNIGTKTIADYAAYAGQYLYNIDVPGVGLGRMFVGQRKDPFVVNLGEVFDLVNTNPLGPENGEGDVLDDANVTSLVLELPIAGLVGQNTILGGWTTASLRQARVLNPHPSGHNQASVEGGAWTQVSRLSSPLVNEVVIGLPDKDRFNASEPKDDAQFLTYVTHPTLPALIEVLFPVTAPTLFPRADLVQAFLTGVTALNENGSVGEMLRLNTSILPVAQGAQSRLGVIGNDLAGFPNGRRPGDDVVDIELRVVMGVLLPLADAPSGQLLFTDGAFLDDSFTDATFPYLKTPLAGAQ
ncbi:MAG: DUF4331 domain-containing protein [Planctomycetes bacterium]|nr:DUF4331 domain-containing protein [Planctomycetota bacterium]